MSIGTLPASRALGPAAESAPGRTVTWLAIRQIRRGGVIVTALAGGMTTLVAATYDEVMADPAAAGSLRALAGNPAIRTLFGTPVGLDTAGGFVVWRVGTVIAVLLAAWSILATTRITRGEEDSGRWDLLLVGRVPLRVTLIRHLTAVMAVLGRHRRRHHGHPVVGRHRTGRCARARGRHRPARHVLRRGGRADRADLSRPVAAATGAAVAVLGIGLLARMVGDGVTALGWLHWPSPFGLLALSGPYVHDSALPLLLLAAATVLVAAVALVAAQPPRRARWPGPGGGRSAAAGAPAGERGDVRGTPGAAPAERLDDRDRRLLPADRADRGVGHRLPARQPGTG
nr:hypothetical protein GCM10020092_074630 [Actinoplanes digitatis]